nr:BAG family molecular chaperone regulator 4-like [Ipomoea batatas]
MMNCSNSEPVSNGGEEIAAWDLRPGGMIVQKRDGGSSGPTAATVTVKLSYGSQQLDLTVPSDSTFGRFSFLVRLSELPSSYLNLLVLLLLWGQVKDIIAQVIGLEPKLQKLLFRGKEKEDQEYLSVAGVKDNSKLLLMEDTTSTEKTPEEVKENSVISIGGEAVAEVRAEVDKLSEQVDALQAVIDSGTKVDDKDIIYLTEMLMRQLLKLDGIEAEGDGKVQRKMEVRRVQSLVDKMDVLKGKNSNPFSDSSNSVSVQTQWETFESGVGSLNPPPPRDAIRLVFLALISHAYMSVWFPLFGCRNAVFISFAPLTQSDKGGGLRYTSDRDFTLHGEIMLLLLVLLLAAFLVSVILFLWVKQFRFAAAASSRNYDSENIIDASGDSAAALFHTQSHCEFGRAALKQPS